MRKDLYDEHVIHGTIGFPVGIYNFSNPYEDEILFAVHYHREFELLIVTEGKVKLQVENDTYFLEHGQGVFINSCALHSTFSLTKKCRCMAIVFSPEFIAHTNEELYEKYINPLVKGHICVSIELTKEIVELSLTSNTLFQSAENGFELFIKSNLTRIIAILVCNAKYTISEKRDTKTTTVKIVLDYIHNNYMNTITLTDMAKTAHISKEYLCSLFKEVSDFSPITYLNRYRIMQSANMLRNTNKNISEIALKCSFNKQFLHFMKCTPKEYKKRF